MVKALFGAMPAALQMSRYLTPAFFCKTMDPIRASSSHPKAFNHTGFVKLAGELVKHGGELEVARAESFSIVPAFLLNWKAIDTLPKGHMVS